MSECQTSYIEHTGSPADNSEGDAAGRSDTDQTECLEHVGQIGASARFHFVSPNGILGHRLVRKPAYEKGRE
jgi:hypothetical protein